MATRAVVLGLLGKGIITPNSDSDDSKKERDATSLYGKTGSIKVGDLDVSLRWFGQPGMLLNSMAKKYQKGIRRKAWPLGVCGVSTG